MSGVLDSIGLISGVLGIVSFFQSNLPGSNPQGASVQIKGGLGDDSSSNLKGTIDHIYAFDFNNNYLGQTGSCGFDYDGGSCTKTVNQGGAGIQSDYISIANGNDATCIAWVSVRQYDGSPGGSWTGDISRACGGPWYYGNQVAGNFKNGGNWRPACGWFDGDHTNGYQYASMKFTVRAYGELSEETRAQNKQCSATIFGTDNGPINGTPQKPATRKRRSSDLEERDLADRLPWMTTRLIKSNLSDQSAEDLCSSPTSWGPDFVDADGNFCDMETHTLHAACSLDNLLGCVDVALDGTVASVAGGLEKSYEVLSVWDEE